MARIVFVTQFFPSCKSNRNTGGTISNINFLRSIANSNEVFVLSFDTESDPSEFIKEPFVVKKFLFASLNGRQLFFRWNKYVKDCVEKFVIECGGVDFLVATTSCLPALASVSGPTKKISIVQAYENFGFKCRFVPFKQRVKLAKQALIRHFQDSRALINSDAVIVYSNFMKSAVIERFSLDSSRVVVLKQLCEVDGLREEPPRAIGFVSRGEEKGLALVLSLAARMSSLKFHIFGHDQPNTFSSLSNVIWHGWVTDKGYMYSTAKLWLMPSLWEEPLGRVALEAQIAGCAVLVSAAGGLPETVIDKRFLIKDRDVVSWELRINTLLDIPYPHLIENSRLILKNHSQNSHDELISDIF